MARQKTSYVCGTCGARTAQWQGQCPACEAWNTLELAVSSIAPAGASRNARTVTAGPSTSRTVTDIAQESDVRAATGIGELDRVLGGGLVAGSVVLLGGDPGIGKSTLLLQAADALSRERPVLYVSGEESVRQVASRAQRLGLDSTTLRLAAETRVETVLEEAVASRAQVLVIDSIQTMQTELSESSAGSAVQVRESAAQLVRFAKAAGTAVLLIGHVTKEGLIAGPRILEHMVDTVLYFESDPASRFRLVRAVKNRFGAANELGVFAMVEQGLREVRNPSAIFLSRHPQPVSGSVVTVVREGSRPLLVEVQALVDEAQGMNPRRVAVGFESSRLALLLAVLHLKFRDTSQIWELLVMAGFFLSPVIYPLDVIPAQYHTLLFLNPVTGLIQYSRLLLLQGQLPSLIGALYVTLVTGAILALGIWLFRRHAHMAAEQL